MRKTFSVIGIMVMLALMAACGGAAEPAPSPEASAEAPAAAAATSPATSPAAAAAASPAGAPSEVTIQLGTLNDSGESGTATLTAAGAQTKVVLNVTGQPAGVDQPTHIHEGTCANLNPQPAFPLTDVKDGKSETTIDASLSDLLSGKYAINVHKSAADLATYVVCGDLPKVGPNEATIQLGTLNDSGESGTATLTAAGAQTKVVLNVTGQPAGVDQPTHVHEGTCANLNPQPAFPLTDVKDGKSETTIDASLSDLLSGKYAINVHKSAADLATYVVCGDLPKVAMQGGTEHPAGGSEASPAAMH